jgi:hypothetical protein
MTPRPGTPRRHLSTYTDSHPHTAERMCRLGATQVQLADLFGVSTTTIGNWLRQHAPFAEAVRRGKAIADLKVTESLYRRACGFRHPDVKIFRHGEKIIVKRFTRRYPADTPACALWLKNRSPKLWHEPTRAVPAARAERTERDTSQQPSFISQAELDRRQALYALHQKQYDERMAAEAARVEQAVQAQVPHSAPAAGGAGPAGHDSARAAPAAPAAAAPRPAPTPPPSREQIEAWCKAGRAERRAYGMRNSYLTRRD